MPIPPLMATFIVISLIGVATIVSGLLFHQTVLKKNPDLRQKMNEDGIASLFMETHPSLKDQRLPTTAISQFRRAWKMIGIGVVVDFGASLGIIYTLMQAKL
jgi:hypothetical protein